MNNHNKETRAERERALVETILTATNEREKGKAVQILYKQYFQTLKFMFIKRAGNTANVQDAEDLSLKTLEKVIMRLEQYDKKFAFSTWVYKIAQNTMIDEKRMSKSVDVISVDDMNSEDNDGHEGFVLPSDGPTPFDIMRKEERAKRIVAMVDALHNKDQKMAVKLRYFSELSYEEISEQMQKPLNTVKTILNRAKINLQNSKLKELVG